MQHSAWKSLMDSLGLPPSMGTYRELVNAYSEPHRHYHTIEHIEDCLGQLEAFREHIPSVLEVELALWFHDAVYKTRSGTNEKDSADWAVSFLNAAGASDDCAERVREHVMATCHGVPIERTESQWVVDIDLSILGRDERTYAEFEEKVRREYWWVPAPTFKKKRTKILASFLNRPSIYLTPHFKTQFESAARRNLSWAIAQLDA